MNLSPSSKRSKTPPRVDARLDENLVNVSVAYSKHLHLIEEDEFSFDGFQEERQLSLNEWVGVCLKGWKRKRW